MKKTLFLIAVISALCCGCSNTVPVKANTEQNEQVIAELLSEIDELKKENAGLTEELKQRQKEIDQRNLEIDNFKKQKAETIPDDLYLVNVSSREGLNVRSGPGKDYMVIGSVASQSYIKVLSFKDEWAEIVYGDGTGYVNALFIDPLVDRKYTESDMS